MAIPGTAGMVIEQNSRAPWRRIPVVLLAAGATAVAACAGTAGRPLADVRAPAVDCDATPHDHTGAPADVRVRWWIQSSDSDRDELDEWCRGVGAPVILAAAGSAARVDSVAVITWNIHVGAARVDSLVRDLHSGALTGTPTPHFVLLLQEARRRGGSVPAVLGRDARGARRLGDPYAGAEADIIATAQRLGLRLFYVPSMRNGEGVAEDRGNAILTTLPLTDLTAIELPLLAQRRVAVTATIPLLDAAGRERRLRVTSVHLDVGSTGGRRPLALFGSGRTLQADALADALAGTDNTLVGGDFNTWSHERLERGLTLMRQGFPDLPGVSTEPTFYTAGFWPRRLDHLFLRSTEFAGSAPARIDDRYGSDHHPVLAWIRPH